MGWELRARSKDRNFYVASHPGWSDPRVWDAQAKVDLDLYLWRMDRERLSSAQVLEIGCGVGRLAAHLAPLVGGYTGIDIAPSMIAEAKACCAGLANARFFESNGVELPLEACDRRYGFALAAAVFIHCPRDVIASLMRTTFAQLEPGAQLRFQLLANPGDPTGLDSSPTSQANAELNHANAQRAEMVATDDIRSLTDDGAYMGDTFEFAQVEPFIVDAIGAPARIYLARPTRMHVYGFVEKP